MHVQILMKMIVKFPQFLQTLAAFSSLLKYMYYTEFKNFLLKGISMIIFQLLTAKI